MGDLNQLRLSSLIFVKKKAESCTDLLSAWVGSLRAVLGESSRLWKSWGPEQFVVCLQAIFGPLSLLSWSLLAPIHWHYLTVVILQVLFQPLYFAEPPALQHSDLVRPSPAEMLFFPWKILICWKQKLFLVKLSPFQPVDKQVLMDFLFPHPRTSSLGLNSPGFLGALEQASYADYCGTGDTKSSIRLVQLFPAAARVGQLVKPAVLATWKPWGLAEDLKF